MKYYRCPTLASLERLVKRHNLQFLGNDSYWEIVWRASKGKAVLRVESSTDWGYNISGSYNGTPIITEFDEYYQSIQNPT